MAAAGFASRSEALVSRPKPQQEVRVVEGSLNSAREFGVHVLLSFRLAGFDRW